MSATFTVTGTQVITEAWQKLGVLAEGQPASANQLAKGLLGLNILFKMWEQKGYKGWTYRVLTFPFQAALGSYTIGPSGATVTSDVPVRVAQAWWQQGSPANRTPMVPCSIEEFNRLTPVSTPGLPNTWNYQPPNIPDVNVATRVGTFRVWPVPTTNGVTTGEFFGLSLQRPIADLTAVGNEMDILQTTFAACVYGLADWLVTDSGVNERTAQRIERRAEQMVGAAFDFEEEDASVSFQPSPRF